MEKQSVKKIVVIGPESTGKSTLCELLAQHYEMQWCPEFAREYLITNGKEYDHDELLTIAKGQIALEGEYLSMVNREWSINSEKYYWYHRPEYYKNFSLGFNYYALFWDRCIPFLLISAKNPQSVVGERFWMYPNSFK